MSDINAKLGTTDEHREWRRRMAREEILDRPEFNEVTVLPATPLGPSDALTDFADPMRGLARAQVLANALKDVIQKQKLSVMIQGREHIRIEGWLTLGAMCGVTASTAETREDESGFWAKVNVIRLATGDVIGSAESRCDHSERNWKDRDSHALLSMAQTRAASKALAQCLRWVATLAGYSGTPAEEMPTDVTPREPPKPRPDPVTARPRPKAESIPADTAWMDETLAFGKFKQETWRTMSEGSIDGARHSYLTWMVSQKAGDQRQAISQARARVLLSGYEAQRKLADAQLYPASPEWETEELPPVPDDSDAPRGEK